MCGFENYTFNKITINIENVDFSGGANMRKLLSFTHK